MTCLLVIVDFFSRRPHDPDLDAVDRALDRCPPPADWPPLVPHDAPPEMPVAWWKMPPLGWWARIMKPKR
jgi:hypothetical protein